MMILEFRVRIARPSQHAYFVVFVVFAGRDGAMSCGRRDKCGARGRWEPLRAGAAAGDTVLFYCVATDEQLPDGTVVFIGVSDLVSLPKISKKGKFEIQVKPRRARGVLRSAASPRGAATPTARSLPVTTRSCTTAVLCYKVLSCVNSDCVRVGSTSAPPQHSFLSLFLFTPAASLLGSDRTAC